MYSAIILNTFQYDFFVSSARLLSLIQKKNLSESFWLNLFNGLLSWSRTILMTLMYLSLLLSLNPFFTSS